MIKDKEAIKAFEVMHDYCCERECKDCIFLDENCEHGGYCLLRNNNLAYLHIEEAVTYKIKAGG